MYRVIVDLGFLNTKVFPIFVFLLFHFNFAKGQATIGPNFPSANATVNFDNSNWSNGTETYSSNNTYCGINNNSFDNNNLSDRIHLTGFGFAIPSTATINGITVEIERFMSQGSCRDENIQLINGSSSLVGDNKATATTWAGTDPNSYITYGGSTDDWNASLTAADLNSANFGVAIQARASSNNTRPRIDHVRISVTYTAEGPAGIFTNMQLWIKADAGVLNGGAAASDGQAVNTWEDQSGIRVNNANDAQVPSPTFRNNATDNINFNPTVEFDGVDDGLDFGTEFIYSSGAGSEDGMTIFFVAKPDQTTGKTRQFIYDFGYFGNKGYGVYYGSSHLGLYSPTDNGGAKSGIIAHSFDTTAVVGRAVYDFGNEQSLTVNAASTAAVANVITVPALSATEVNESPTHDIVDGPTTIGRLSKDDLIANDGGRLFDGKISELIIFSRKLSTTEIERVESYLGVKYGITLDNSAGGTAGDYQASDGTQFWDASLGGEYHNQIVTLGRDDSGNLYQKQASTSDDSLVVYVSSLAASNPANLGVINNDVSFITVGNNSGRLHGKETEIPVGIYSRFHREWKVTNVNFSDNFNMKFEWDEVGPFDINDIRLLVDDDGDFSDATVLSNLDGLSISEGSIIIENISNVHIPMNSTRFVTVGSISSNTPLPVDLVSFEVESNHSGGIALQWATISELNSDYFQIERSVSGNSWKTLARVSASGFTNHRIAYSYIDNDPISGKSYYRLKIVDLDGSFEYSPIKSANLQGPDIGRMNIYPNPAKNTVFISGNTTSLQEIHIFDQRGAEITRHVQIHENSNSEIELNLMGLDPGIYILKVNNMRAKLIKE